MIVLIMFHMKCNRTRENVSNLYNFIFLFYTVQTAIMNFFNTPDCDKILFTLNSSGVLTVINDFPEDIMTNKISYFIKLELVEVTDSNYEVVLIYGDVSSSPIEDLEAITKNVSDNNICNRKRIIVMCIYDFNYQGFDTLIFDKR